MSQYGGGAPTLSFEPFSDGVGVRHVRHQPASPCINVHVSPWRQRGLDDAVRIVRLVDTKALGGWSLGQGGAVPRLTGVPTHRKGAGRSPCVASTSGPQVLTFQCRQSRAPPCKGDGRRTNRAAWPTHRLVRTLGGWLAVDWRTWRTPTSGVNRRLWKAVRFGTSFRMPPNRISP